MVEETEVTNTPSMTNNVTDVSGSAISNSFKGILRVSSDSSGVGESILTVCSSDGAPTSLGLSGNGVRIKGSLNVDADVTAGTVTANSVSITSGGKLLLGDAGLTVTGPFTAGTSTFNGPITINAPGLLTNEGKTVLNGLTEVNDTATFNGVTTFSENASTTFDCKATFSNGIDVSTSATFNNNCLVKIGGGVTIDNGALICNAPATFTNSTTASSITTSVINSPTNVLNLSANATTNTPAVSETDESRIVTIGYINSRLNTLPNQMPVGSILMWGAGASSAPAGWCLCDGRALSRTTYKDLFNIIGTTYGKGNGSSTFNIPDFRGLFPRGLDNGRGVDSGRTLGTRQMSGVPNITGSINNVYGGYGTYTSSGAFETIDFSRGTRGGGGGDPPNKNISFDASRSSSVYKNGLKEVRPENLSVNFIIKIQNVGEVPYDVAVKYKTNHASASAEFGVASGANYGHVRLTETLDKDFENKGITSGIALTPKAVSKIPGVLIDSWRSGANWYRKYSDGFIEQGGTLQLTTTITSVTFKLPFTNQPMVLFGRATNRGARSHDNELYPRAITTTGFTYAMNTWDVSVSTWYACGY